jgi:hypothetical protein
VNERGETWNREEGEGIARFELMCGPRITDIKRFATEHNGTKYDTNEIYVKRSENDTNRVDVKKYMHMLYGHCNLFPAQLFWHLDSDSCARCAATRHMPRHLHCAAMRHMTHHLHSTVKLLALAETHVLQ